MKKPTLDEITIRTELRPGDIGNVVLLHGELYSKEYSYGIEFEAYVAEGLAEFYHASHQGRHRVWVCEHGGKMVGFLLLFDRGESAQLRYFIIRPEYRGAGLGKRLMQLYMDYLRSARFTSSYLWTTHELPTAASLYKMHGFKLVEEKDSAGFGKKLIEQKYELHL